MSCHFYSQITCDQTFLHFSDIYMSDLQKHNFRIMRPAFGRVVCSGGQTTALIVGKQAYSERQDFPPFPLLETRSFFLIWYYTIKRSDNWAWGRSK